MTKVQQQPKPDWAPLPRPGCTNVEARVLLVADGISLAMLRFSENATIDEHDAPYEVDVICLSGSGFTSIGTDTFPIRSGERIRWPRDTKHRLWTDSSQMETLMVERHDG